MNKKCLILLTCAVFMGLTGMCVFAQSTSDVTGAPVSPYGASEENSNNNNAQNKSQLYEKSSGMIKLDTSTDAVILEEKEPNATQDSSQG